METKDEIVSPLSRTAEGLGIKVKVVVDMPHKTATTGLVSFIVSASNSFQISVWVVCVLLVDFAAGHSRYR